jgi:hypothetical protein
LDEAFTCSRGRLRVGDILDCESTTWLGREKSVLERQKKQR